MTRSMKKNKDIILLIKEVNISMKNKYSKIKFGYVIYRDFDESDFKKVLGIYSHIEVLNLNSDDFLPESKINFYGGGDWAEDWANAYYAISQINYKQTKENIIIHICDAGAHSTYFSYYDNHDEQENLLKEALEKCSSKNLKIIGFLYNNFSRKSFRQCQNYYCGYYDVVDLACSGEEFTKEIIQEKLQKALKNERILNIDDYTNIKGFEDNFYYCKHKVHMSRPSGLNFLPNISNKSDLVKLIKDRKIGIEQGYLGNCYLISSILSIIFGNYPIVNYIFPKSKEYNEFSGSIRMLVFENGLMKEIFFNNTYPLNQFDKFVFGNPRDNSFYSICIEKGYAAYYSNKIRNFKPEKINIKSGYENIIGGYQYEVFNFLFGSSNEFYNLYKINNIFGKEKIISKDNLKNKIIKYLDNKGLVAFHVFF